MKLGAICLHHLLVSVMHVGALSALSFSRWQQKGIRHVNILF